MVFRLAKTLFDSHDCPREGLHARRVCWIQTSRLHPQRAPTVVAAPGAAHTASALSLKFERNFRFVRYLLCDTFALPKLLCTSAQKEQQMASQSIQALVALLCACFSHEPKMFRMLGLPGHFSEPFQAAVTQNLS